MPSFRIGSITLDILEGDITSQNVDAIVNAANDALWMGGGVAGAIKSRGGGIIEREAIALGPIDPGDAVVTTAGRLPARYVIHAAVMGQDLRTCDTFIGCATTRALDRARELNLASVAFPALGTGVGAFPLERCAEIMIDAIQAHAGQASSVASIALVLYGEEPFRVFTEVARRKIELRS